MHSSEITIIAAKLQYKFILETSVVGGMRLRNTSFYGKNEAEGE